MSQVRKVTANEFAQEVTHSSVPVVVDVYADWCGPCRALAPLLERVAEILSGRVKFLKINIDEDPEVAQLYRVEGVPTLLFFRDGELIDRVVGVSDLRALVAKFERLATVGATA